MCTDMERDTLSVRTGVKVPPWGSVGWAPDVARPTPAPEKVPEDVLQSWSCWHSSNISLSVS